VEVAAGGGVSVAEGAAAGGVAGCGSRLSGGGTTAAMVVGRVLAQPPSRRWLVWPFGFDFDLGHEDRLAEAGPIQFKGIQMNTHYFLQKNFNIYTCI
jgi:hypothetical protein